MRKCVHRRVTPALLVAAAVAAAAPTAPAAGAFTVNNANDTGLGSLRQAMLDANAAGGGTINVKAGGQVSLASPLPMVTAPLILNGNNLLISGNNQYRILFVDAHA